MGTKRQHYVPRFYLENFSNNRRVVVYDKTSGKLIKKNIDETCIKNNLYENTWKEPNSILGKYPQFIVLFKE